MHRLTQTFDFVDYLRKRTGRDFWIVEPLTGGDANYTIRARQRGDHPSVKNLLGCWDGRGSVIMKQAPPFMAKLPSLAFSPRRQEVEAKTLDLFLGGGSSIQGPEAAMRCNPDIQIPKLLHYDRQGHVLAQADLGNHPNLHEVLTSQTFDPILAVPLGRIIAKFLANMHDSLANDDLRMLAERYQNPDGEQLMLRTIQRAVGFMKEAGIEDHQLLGSIATDHWATRERNAFSQGDIWFGTLLVDLQSGPTSPIVGICDWEFAGPNDRAADLGQLGSYLHLLSLSHVASAQTKDHLRTFARVMYETYRTHSVIQLDSSFLRSLLIIHGWEMINAAGWQSRQDMWCRCVGEGIRCNHIKALIREGALLLRIASSATVDMRMLGGSTWYSYFAILDDTLTEYINTEVRV